MYVCLSPGLIVCNAQGNYDVKTYFYVTPSGFHTLNTSKQSHFIRQLVDVLYLFDGQLKEELQTGNLINVQIMSIVHA